MRKKIQKVLKIYGVIERVFLSAMFVFMLMVLLLQIISRYIFNSPVIWTDEITTLLQVSLAFLGIGYGIRKKSHVELSGFYDRFPETVQHIITIVTNLFIIWCLYCIIKEGFFYADQQWAIKTMTTRFMNGYFFICVPIGLIEAVVYLGFGTVDQIMYLLHKQPIFRVGEV